MSFPRYPKYRSADLPWVLEVPSHWATTQLRFLLKDGKEGIRIGPFGSSIKIDDLVQYGPKVYGQENVIYRDFTLGDRRIAESHFNDLAEYEIRSGDVLVTMAGTAGRCQVVPNQLDRGIMDSHLVRMRFRSDLVYEPLVPYLIESAAYVVAQIHVAGRGTTMQGLNSTIVKHLQLGLPSRSEQVTIAAFLDRETAKIDALIAEQQRLIELLQEKRQAVISHAVTKGLNPDAPMKDSGIEWLGEVPKHWQVRRLGVLFRQVNEQGKDDLPILSVSIHDGVSDKEIAEEELDRKVNRSDDRTKYKRVAAGDLVYNMMRAWQGGFGTVAVEGMVSPAYVVARPRSEVVTSYIEHVLRTPAAIEQMRRHSRGITDFRLRLYWDEFKNISVPVPPLVEVKEICAAIYGMAEQAEALEAEACGAITLLQERRSVLISASVTGQIDVRGHAEPEAA
jgi:type I restriction enzyme S subunit